MARNAIRYYSKFGHTKKMVEAVKGIAVSTKEFTCSGSMGPVKAGHPDDADIRAFKDFVRTILDQ